MFQKKGFDSQKYSRLQTNEILKRIKKFKRLYLEIGGKLLSDEHASRVLPGYDKKIKIKILKKLGKIEIIYCINAKDLQSRRVLGKAKRSYEKQSIKEIKKLSKNFKIYIVITRFTNEEKAIKFSEKLEKKFPVYFHKDFEGYTKKASNAIRSYEIQAYIPVKEKLIIVTGPAGGSGKMATALNQINYEIRKKVPSGFAKFETFPIWNLPLNHPVNLAYEAATADLQDKNMIDPYYKKFYNKIAINYNRDINNFSILQEICRRITKQKFPFGYKSPTDMGVNMAKFGIINNEICEEAAKKEILSRYEFYKKEYKKGRENEKTLKRMEEITRNLNDITKQI